MFEQEQSSLISVTKGQESVPKVYIGSLFNELLDLGGLLRGHKALAKFLFQICSFRIVEFIGA